MIDPQLENKIAIVTGANNPIGIGAAIAKALAIQGVKVFLTYVCIEATDNEPKDSPYVINRAKDASEVVQAIRDAGGICEAQEVDISNPKAIPTLFDTVEATFGHVDILINNAAHWEPDTFIPKGEELANQFSVSWMDNAISSFDPELHNRIFAVNTRATAQMMAEFAKRHILHEAKWGRIINISSSGSYSFPSEISYGASKYALESYSRAAAAELGQFGITVNIISPGPIQTGYITPEMESAIAQDTPLRRVGFSEDIADVAVFLASQQAKWVTGQLLHVGGGHTM
jgi:3-oxoacyl-[acyl-carrier protein] reductase